MDKINELLAANKVLRDKAKKEERDLTPDEVKSINDNLDEIEQHEAVVAAEKRQKEIEDRLNKPEPPATVLDTANLSDPKIVVGEDRAAKKPFNTFGEQLQAVYRASCTPAVVDPRLFETRTQPTGLGESIPSEGGFLVQTDFAETLWQKVHETGLLASKCQQIPISPGKNGLKMNVVDETSRADGSRLGGIRMYWEEEADSPTATKPKFRQIELSLKKLFGLCYATDELLDDAMALEAVVTQGFGDEGGFKIDDGILNGTGAGQLLGILNSLALVSVAKETGQAAATFEAENAMKMYARMWSRSLPRSVWLINQELWPQIFQLHLSVGTGGVPLFIEAGKIANTPFGSLLGRPILPVEQCQALGTKGDIYLVDLSQYLLIEKGGVQTASSIHVKFINDETTFRFIYRVDGQPLWTAALTPFKGTSSTQSPYVALAARS